MIGVAAAQSSQCLQLHITLHLPPNLPPAILFFIGFGIFVKIHLDLLVKIWHPASCPDCPHPPPPPAPPQKQIILGEAGVSRSKNCIFLNAEVLLFSCWYYFRIAQLV